MNKLTLSRSPDRGSYGHGPQPDFWVIASTSTVADNSLFDHFDHLDRFRPSDKYSKLLSTNREKIVSEHSKIEWTEATWNPVRGCIKISPGCKHCYAETFAERFRGVKDHPYERGFDPRLIPEKLLEPLRWSLPKLVFVNSMSDLFQDAVPEAYIASVAEVMRSTPWHTYQILTKRASRMADLLSSSLKRYAKLSNAWWGVSVEDRKHGVPRIDELQRVPTRIRFLSIEPLLEDLGPINLKGIQWVIVGGESGPGARKMESIWVESLRDQCSAAGVPFFFKQWGGVQKSRTGRKLNGKTYDELPTIARAIHSPSLAERRILLEQHKDLVRLGLDKH